jgi:hypothetical protein
MAEKTETKMRIKDARKITDPAKMDSQQDMLKAVCAAWDVPASVDNKLEAESYLIRLGYGKLRSTTKWARENPDKVKPARKPARKAKPAKRAKVAIKVETAPATVGG